MQGGPELGLHFLCATCAAGCTATRTETSECQSLSPAYLCTGGYERPPAAVPRSSAPPSRFPLPPSLPAGAHKGPRVPTLLARPSSLRHYNAPSSTFLLSPSTPRRCPQQARPGPCAPTPDRLRHLLPSVSIILHPFFLPSPQVPTRDEAWGACVCATCKSTELASLATTHILDPSSLPLPSPQVPTRDEA